MPINHIIRQFLHFSVKITYFCSNLLIILPYLIKAILDIVKLLLNICIRLIVVKHLVLLVEDDPIVRQVHTYFLKKLGFTVSAVSTGKQALASMKEKKFAALVVDLGLSDMDGTLIVSKVREREVNTDIRMPIIMITAHGDEDIFRRSKEMGADICLNKPVSLAKFRELFLGFNLL